MNLSSGARLGPYEVIAPLGAGGMGEVWRARDTRLSREVAVKVLPAELAADPGRLRRFEKEARAASALNHPNIVTIYEIGSADSVSYIAMERVEGSTLRELLVGGPLPIKKLLKIATQMADGLAKAHEAGIVHRDLKPENVMVTKDGLVKILDFGLAKLTQSSAGSGEGSQLQTDTRTSPGMVVGTASYMSPEQASGETVDFRSDQFSFGSILYEMATGKRAFSRKTGVDTLGAILNEEPEPIGQINPQVPAPLRWIVERCHAKEPESRYLSTGDLARELASLRDHLSEASGSVPSVEAPRRRFRVGEIGLAAALLVIIGAVFWLGRRVERAHVSSPHFRQLTFRGAGIGSARFSPDGQTIVYSSQLEGKPPELFALRLDSPETRSLGLPPAHILSISSSGQMAVLLLRPFALSQRIGHMAYEQVVHRDPFLLAGTLAEAPLAGGAPRELLEDVLWADWAPNGKGLAVVHRVGNRGRVESPIGKVIYDEESKLLNHVRTSPTENAVAFKDWEVLYVKNGRQPVRKFEVDDWESVWSPVTGELWYASHPESGGTEIHAITQAGRDRLVTTLPLDYLLYDISPAGRVLLGSVMVSGEVLASLPGDSRERNLSHLDYSEAFALTLSGEALFNESDKVGSPAGVYIRKIDGSAPKLLKSHYKGYTLSPDGKLVLADEWGPSNRLSLLPTGVGQTRELQITGVEPEFIELDRARFSPDGKRLFLTARQPGRRPRIWALDLEGGKPLSVTPEDVTRLVLLGDGRFACARAGDFEWYLYPVDDKVEPRRVAGLMPGEEAFDSTPDGKFLYVRGADELRPGETLITTRVYRLDPWTGRRELWKEIPPANPRTGGGISTILFSADGKTCVYTHYRYSTELVLAEGLR